MPIEIWADLPRQGGRFGEHAFRWGLPFHGQSVRGQIRRWCSPRLSIGGQSKFLTAAVAIIVYNNIRSTPTIETGEREGRGFAWVFNSVDAKAQTAVRLGFWYLLCTATIFVRVCLPVYPLQFEMHGADAEGYEEYAPVQAEGNYDGAERSIIQRNFVLNDEHYSVFNT